MNETLDTSEAGVGRNDSLQGIWSLAVTIPTSRLLTVSLCQAKSWSSRRYAQGSIKPWSSILQLLSCQYATIVASLQKKEIILQLYDTVCMVPSNSKWSVPLARSQLDLDALEDQTSLEST